MAASRSSCEQFVGQEVDILGKQAEQHLLREVGHPQRVMPSVAPGQGQSANLGRRLFGEVRPGLSRAELIGLGEGPLQEVERRMVPEIVEFDLVDLGHQAGKGGMDADDLDIGNDEERRVAQGRGVFLELL